MQEKVRFTLYGLLRIVGRHTVVQMYKLLGLSLFCLSLSPVLVRYAPASPAAIGAYRMLGTAAALFFILAGQQRFDFRRAFQIHFSTHKTQAHTLLAGLLFGAHIWTFVEAAQTTSISHLVFIFATHPIFTALGSLWLFRQPLPKQFIVAYPVALAGLIFLLLEKGSGGRGVTLHGDLMALATAVLHSGYALASKHVRNDMTNTELSFWINLVSGLFFVLIVAAQGELGLTYSSSFYWTVLALIAIPSLLGHSLFTYLLKHINVNFLACSKLAEPGISSLAAYFLFAETIGPLAGLSFVLITMSVAILFWPQRLTQDTPQSPDAIPETRP